MDRDSSFSPHEVRVIDIIIMVSSSLGIIGALFMVVTFALFKEIREFSTKLICLLAVCDFMVSLAWFPFSHTNSTLCVIQAVALQYFLSASFLWTMAISLSLVVAFFPRLQEFEWTLKMRYYHAACWAIPAILVSLSLALGKYENNGVRCFVDSSGLLSLLFYMPLLIVFVINSTVFIIIRVRLARHKGSLESRMSSVVSYYLVAFLSSQLPAVLNGLQRVIHPQHPVFAFYVILAALQPLQGFLNAIVYGFNEGFISQYIYFFENYCGRRFRKGDSFESDMVDTDNLLVEYNYNSDDDV